MPWVKDLVLSLQLLQHRFDPWPGIFCMPWRSQKKLKKKCSPVLSRRFDTACPGGGVGCHTFFFFFKFVIFDLQYSVNFFGTAK